MRKSNERVLNKLFKIIQYIVKNLENQHVCQTESYSSEMCKLSLRSGIPHTVGELKNILRETFAIEED